VRWLHSGLLGVGLCSMVTRAVGGYGQWRIGELGWVGGKGGGLWGVSWCGGLPCGPWGMEATWGVVPGWVVWGGGGGWRWIEEVNVGWWGGS